MRAKGFDAEAVTAFERAGWQRAAAQYRVAFAPATQGFVEALLDAAGVGEGVRVLDLACGAGIAAAAASARGAAPIGVDFSAEMLAVARAAHPGIRFEEADAAALPFADATFDAVVSNFGVHHFAEPVGGLREARRVLRPGGRMAFTSWAAPAENIAWRLLFGAIAAHGDLEAAAAPPSGGGLRGPDDLLRALGAAGFRDSGARLIAGEWPIAAAGGLIEGFRRGTVRTAALIAAQPAAALAAIEQTVAASLAPYRSGGGFVVPTAAILGWGARR